MTAILDKARAWMAGILKKAAEPDPSLEELPEIINKVTRKREEAAAEYHRKREPFLELWITSFEGGVLATVLAQDNEGRTWGRYDQVVMSGICDWCGEKYRPVWREQIEGGSGGLVVGDHHVDVPGYINEDGERVRSNRHSASRRRINSVSAARIGGLRPTNHSSCHVTRGSVGANPVI